jgi:hypothetical protein
MPASVPASVALDTTDPATVCGVTVLNAGETIVYRECGGHASYVILTTAGRKNPVTFCTGCFALLNMTKKTGPVTEHGVTAKKGRGDKAKGWNDSL